MLKQLKHLATTLIIIIEMWLYITVVNWFYLKLPYILGVLALPILMIIVLASLLLANNLINGKGNFVAKIISTVIEWGIALLLFITILSFSERFDFLETDYIMAMFLGMVFFTIVSVGAIIGYLVGAIIGYLFMHIYEKSKASENTSH